jgi:hypothetical protein
MWHMLDGHVLPTICTSRDTSICHRPTSAALVSLGGLAAPAQEPSAGDRNPSRKVNEAKWVFTCTCALLENVLPLELSGMAELPWTGPV